MPLRMPGRGPFRGPMAERFPVGGNLAMRQGHGLGQPHESRGIGFNPRAAMEGMGRAVHEMSRQRGNAGAPIVRAELGPRTAHEVARNQGLERVEREFTAHERMLNPEETELRRMLFEEIKKCESWKEVKELMGKLMQEGKMDRETYNRLFSIHERREIMGAFNPGRVINERIVEEKHPFPRQ